MCKVLWSLGKGARGRGKEAASREGDRRRAPDVGRTVGLAADPFLLESPGGALVSASNSRGITHLLYSNIHLLSHELA